jgi:tetratricopeptide (TPR) repeat protein
MPLQSSFPQNDRNSLVRLSLCMIVKDEEQRLPLCLQSVRDVVDEMIVVDTGSRDRTVEIAQFFGAQVYHQSWQDDFALARNESLKYAKGEWILVLDADETLLADCIPELQRAISAPDCLAITLLRQEIGALQNPYTLVARLFRRHPRIQFQRPYHESIDDCVYALMRESTHWTVRGLSTLAIAHEGYQPDAIAQHNKVDRAERIMSQYLSTHPQDAYICSKLGGLYHAQGRVSEAIGLLEQGLHQPVSEPAVIYELHYHLGLTYTATAQLALAQQHYEQALGVERPILLKIATYINLAALHTNQGQWTKAESLLTQVLAAQPQLAIAHYNLGLIYKTQGKFQDAIVAYEQAIALEPDYPEAYQNLGVVYFKIGQVHLSLPAFQRAIALYETRNPAEALRLRQTLQDLGFQV